MAVVVITGASQGIGAAIARAFATEPGTRLALLSRNTRALEQVAGSCKSMGTETLIVECDVTEEDDVASAASQVASAFGTPDVLVNNAGQFTPGSILEMGVSAFAAQIAVNLTSAFAITRAFLPAMVAARRGHIFFMGSVASIRGYPGGAAYCAAKHGMLGLARSLREEVKPYGLRVTTLLPGATFTASWEGTDLPEERFMPPEDVAQAVLGIYRMSDRTVVEEILLRPQPGDI